MAPKIVHFGIDDCRRIAILKRAGYSVDECRSIAELHVALIGVRGADAVVFNEDHGTVPQEAISLTRATSAVPLILFRSTKTYYDETQFDMAIPAMTDPHKWLNAIAGLIDRWSRLMR